MFAVVAILGALVLGSHALAQDIDSTGPCNQNVTGQGNTVIVNCTINGAPSESSDEVFDIAINFAGGPTIQTWFRNQFGGWSSYYPDMSFVDQWSSSFEMRLDGTRYYFPFAETFEGDFQELEPGRHRYSMVTEIVYWNGFSTRASCRGILDLQSEASLIPRQNVEVNTFTGQIFPIDCGFIANQ